MNDELFDHYENPINITLAMREKLEFIFYYQEYIKKKTEFYY